MWLLICIWQQKMCTGFTVFQKVIIYESRGELSLLEQSCNFINYMYIFKTSFCLLVNLNKIWLKVVINSTRNSWTLNCPARPKPSHISNYLKKKTYCAHDLYTKTLVFQFKGRLDLLKLPRCRKSKVSFLSCFLETSTIWISSRAFKF